MQNRSLTIFKRIIIGGLTSFYRNKTVSLSSIAILTTTLLIIGIFFFFRGIFDYTLAGIKDKVDIKIYLKTNATDIQINNLKNKIMALPQVKSLTLTSPADALIQFKEKHKSDQITVQALEEIGVNPFGATFSILAHNTTDYDIIANSLNSDSSFLGETSSVVDKINYFQLKNSIDKLNNIIGFINTVGYWISLLFIIISAMIIYNTTRLAIFVFRDEISVMRLVGASNMFIRGPFLIESMIYGIISSLITIILFYPLTYYFAQRTIVFFSGLNIHTYYLNNIFSLFILLLISSLILTTVSSYLAVRKYLTV